MRTVLRRALPAALAITCLVGTAPGAAGACPNESLRYGYGAHLPDCRAYEQATPVEKDGAVAQSSYNAVQSAAGGGGVTFFAQAGMPGGTGAGGLPLFLSMRNGEEWTTQGLQPPPSAGQVTNVIGWTPNLAESFGYGAEFLGKGFDLVMRNDIFGSTQTIVPYTDKAESYAFAGASANGEEVYFEQSDVPLTPEAAGPRKDNLYVWDQATGAVSLVGVLPASDCGSPPCAPTGGSFAGAYDWLIQHNLRTGGATHYHLTQAQHTISADGERAYFTAGGTGQIYLREDPTSPSAITVQVSASQKTNGTGPGGTDPNGPQPAAFMMATPNGSQAFFTSPEELTNDANTGTADEGNDLYRYEAGSGNLTDLTPDGSDPSGAEVLGAIGVSEDGAYVYFAANGDLDGAGPAAHGNCSNQERTGECSLYLWHHGEITFVARLNAEGGTAANSTTQSDITNWDSRGKSNGGSYVPYVNTARLAAGGQILLFRSQSKLTAYENNGISEFYRYDAQTKQINCVSCNPSGESPETWPTVEAHTSYSSACCVAGINTRILSASGAQVFFETPESLLSADSNGVDDVYEWEAVGYGSCERATADGGCLYLLSTGTSPEPSHFADASVSGEEAFIFTAQSLVGQDQDELVDVYDVRIDGGLASQRATPAASCSGDECKAPAGVGLVSAPPASTMFAGVGNLAAQHPGCASLASRAKRLTDRAKARGHRARSLRRRVRRLSHRGKRHEARHVRSRAQRERRKARRLRREARAAAVEARKCRSASERAAK